MRWRPSTCAAFLRPRRRSTKRRWSSDRKSTRSELQSRQYLVCRLLLEKKNFCWAGRGLYGLARHRLVPGARSLAEAAYAILMAAPGETHVEEVDFVLKQFT